CEQGDATDHGRPPEAAMLPDHVGGEHETVNHAWQAREQDAGRSILTQRKSLAVILRCERAAPWLRASLEGRRPGSGYKPGPHPSRLGRRQVPAPLAPQDDGEREVPAKTKPAPIVRSAPVTTVRRVAKLTRSSPASAAGRAAPARTPDPCAG